MRFNLSVLQLRKPMASPIYESPTLSFSLGIDVEEDYGSNTDVLGEKRIFFNSPVQEATPHTAPNSFAELGETTALVAQHHATDAGERITTNSLNEQQKLILQREGVLYVALISRRLLKSGVVTCFQHQTWSNVSVKRKAIAFQHGPLTQSLHRQRTLRSARF